MKKPPLWKTYLLYLIRWQLSSPILFGALYFFHNYLNLDSDLLSTIIANLIGGFLFFWVDKYLIFK